MTDEITPRDEEAEAIKSIAASRDGAMLHRYLRRVLETVVDLQDDCALRQQNGRRSLARDLMRLMAEGLDAGRTHSSADDPILTRPRGPTAVAGRARRDRSLLPRVDSFSDDLNPDGTKPT